MWEGCGSVEAQDSSERKMILGVWGGGRSVGGAWRGVWVDFMGGACV